MQVCSTSTRFRQREARIVRPPHQTGRRARSANLSRGEHDIGPTRGLHAAPRYFQDLSIRVDADNLPGWANQLRHKQRHVAGTTADIENAHA